MTVTVACPLCAHAAEHGYWGRSDVTHCGRGYGGSEPCHRTWSRTSREAHCTVCHRHFGGAVGFDHHLTGPPSKAAIHIDPPGLTQDADGVWRRPPPPQASTRPDGGAVSGPSATPEDSAALPLVLSPHRAVPDGRGRCAECGMAEGHA